MENAIRNLAEQFNFKPVVENESKLGSATSFVVGGMGGSHLAAGILKILNPDADLYIHRDYGLPALSEKRFKNSLFIASSYSGNTEEVLDFAKAASAAGHSLAVMTTGGDLLDFAKENNLPFVVMPNTGIQPRSALGFSCLALAKLMGDEALVAELQTLGSKLMPATLAEEGQKLAEEIQGRVPVIYSSRTNHTVAYNWKIKFNETAKIPAFSNFFSELNHNEMTGFDAAGATKDLAANFHFIFLADADDSPKIMRRMEVLAGLFSDRGLKVNIISMTGGSVFEKIFNSLLLADWTALYLSKIYGTEADQVPMVEEFKRLIA